MNKHAMVVGLGQFGMSIARALAARGVAVVVVDQRQERVQEAGAFAAEALCFDAMDETQLRRYAAHRKDVVVCAIGDEAREASIMVTALLRQMGARRIVARATNDLHERILNLVGAHEVVNPERDVGERMAVRLAYTGVIDVLPLGQDLTITELKPPPSFVGRTLADLSLPKRFNLTVVAIRRTIDGHGRVLVPDPRQPLQSDDILVVAGEPQAALNLAERA